MTIVLVVIFFIIDALGYNNSIYLGDRLPVVHYELV